MSLRSSRSHSARAVFGPTAASLAVLMLATSGAFAQESGGPVETVTVSGFRASLENTIALKKNSTQILEAISAEDVGKLPDQSIAEAIARLPGLTAQRLNGRSQDISIRGLAPDFSTTLLNGREQVSTSNNRSAQFDQYPAELMSGVVVYKTPSADLVGAGLSGTVDMRTIRPLDYDHTIFSVNGRVEGNSQGSLNPNMPRYGYRLGATYVDQFAGGKLGLTIGLAQMDSVEQFLQYGSWGYANGGGGTGVPSADFANGGVKLQANTDDLVRTSAMATLQYRPNENFESTLDVFYTRYRDRVQFSRVEMPLYSWGGQDLQPGFTVGSDGYVSDGTYTPGVKAVNRREDDRHFNDLYAIGWKNVYTAGDLTTTLDLGFSSVQRHDQWFESYGGTGRPGAGALDMASFTTGQDYIQHFKPTLDYGSYNNMLLTSPQGWGGYSGTGEGVHGGQDGYLNYQKVHDYMFTGKLSTEWVIDAGFLKTIHFGVYFTDRHKSLTPQEFYIGTTDNVNSYNNYVTAHGNEAGWVPVSTVVPDQYRLGVSGALKYFGIPGFATWNPQTLLNDGLYTKLPNLNADVTVKGYQVDEMVYTGFVRADITGDIGGVGIDGNAGLQVAMTHQSSDGYQASNGGTLYAHPVLAHGFANYPEFLPSTNLSAHLDDANVIRLGAARELVRARMDQLQNNNEFSFDQAHNFYYYLTTPKPALDLTQFPIWSGTVGNPKLKPWIADAVDISYEYYFSKDGYISIAGFYKYLETYIYKQNQPFNFAGYAYTGGLAPAYTTGSVTQWVNGTGGDMQGVEVSLSLPGRTLADWLDGFGITGNASYTDTSIRPDPSNPAAPLPGLSKAVYNITAYYEMDGFSVRLNQSYRSKFLGETTGFGAGLQNSQLKSQAWLDAQIGYTFEEGSLQGLSVSLQADNLTDQTQTQYAVGKPRQVLDWQRYGTQYLFGVTYKVN